MFCVSFFLNLQDLTRLGRDLKKVIIVDNSPASYAFHPDNAVCFLVLHHLIMENIPIFWLMLTSFIGNIWLNHRNSQWILISRMVIKSFIFHMMQDTGINGRKDYCSSCHIIAWNVSFQIPVQTWFDDANDVELLDIIPVLEQLAEVDSIYTVLRNSNDDMRRSILSEQTETSR